MRVAFLLLTLALAVTAKPRDERIVGGTVTTIEQWPMGVAMLQSLVGLAHMQTCGGSILNNRSVLSAAHCFVRTRPIQWRMRIASTRSNSGGIVHDTERIISHPSFVSRTADSDVAILRTTTRIVFSNSARAGAIAGANYNLPDNSVVWAIGWGVTSEGSILPPERLRQVQVWTVNQAICAQRYGARGRTITANMLCSGWLDVGGRDQCQGDSGGPLLHNNVVVGVCSFGNGCARARYPGVNARVSRFATWITANS
ncbi:trypsin CFT-1-like [Bicyclus anynana]|uniref:Trypsin CFT-1-like n=1 Tax=Bicyclus anynana TaxID=110368 RepID=A0A6J1MS72_BICAN|nr:trypsin CFT-1-like [Bicyclus anynana]